MNTLSRECPIIKRLEKYIRAKDGGSSAKPRKHLLQILLLPEPWMLPPGVVRFGKHDRDGTIVQVSRDDTRMCEH